MSTPIKINKGLKANLPDILDGQINFCTDTGELYIDNGETRTIVSSIYYGESTTGGDVTTKKATIKGFSLKSGARIIIKFKYDNTVSISDLRLNISNTGLKKIIYSGTDELKLLAGVLYDFIYDGNDYILIGDSNIAATYATKEELSNMASVVIRRWD